MRRTILALLFGVLVLGAGTAPAAAESGGVNDPSGDLPERIDVTRLDVENGRHWFTMRAKVVDLRARTGTFEFNYFARTQDGDPTNDRGVIIAVDRVNGQTRARFYGCGWKDCSRDPCPRMRAGWLPDKNIVRVRAPQRCLPWDAAPPPRGVFHVYSHVGPVWKDTTEELVLDRG
ncbi:hypothetical protein [Nocardioides bizhenqiangii]|uniref:PLAT domain-containing protein n=1 Tax=Nocardioides bizhenqiangii TaxID=3095076 RepID=A0ABZ0ZVR2_9ACTN|nr:MULTISPECIES: hypothetical protein [unclassified Nocardioides]MDZ5622518.1 hypothetical protein [Nocardioides sp. HM23]WQQ28323.1 hypothetical protein SHK19_08850 [Nocardioides sp. HM61]